MAFVRGSNPIWLLDDLMGNLFDDTFYMFVLENDLPYIPATVYHSPLGTPWTNPIEFNSNGTLPVDIFFDPGTVDAPILYRLEFRQGPTQADPLIYLVENYSPIGASGATPIVTQGVVSSNQITNPQFALIDFVSPATFTGTVPATVPAAIDIAPGWTLLLTGGPGTATITQVGLNNTTQTPTNAPYALHLVLSGWSTAVLRQRFEQNGMLWDSPTGGPLKYVASSITAKLGSGTQIIDAKLVDSNSVLMGTVLPSTSLITNFVEYLGNSVMPTPTNPNTPPAAYIDYLLTFEQPGSVDVYVTSFQLLVQNTGTNAAYQQDSVNRQIDHTFNVYKDPLIFKPIPSILTGWDFPLNPNQTGLTDPIAISTTAGYTWDQTIMCTFANTVNVTRSSTLQGIQFTTTADNMAFYMLQYLQNPGSIETVLSALSVNINAMTGIHANTTCRVYLYYGNSSSSVPTLATTIGTIGADGQFSLSAANWAEIPHGLLLDQPVTLNQNILTDFGLTGWDAAGTLNASGVKNFAIVVTFLVPTSGTVITVQSVSCVPGTIPTRPAPQTADEVLRECQYYYETSYPVNTPVGTITGIARVNYLVADVSGGNVRSHPTPFDIIFASVKRMNPAMTLYSPSSGNSNTVLCSAYTGGISRGSGDAVFSTNWSISASTKNAYCLPITGNNLVDVTDMAVSTFPFGEVLFDFAADARLGIV